MDEHIPVVFRMRVACARCGHSEDSTYEFDMPIAEAEPMDECVSGTCPDCGAPIQMHPKRWRQMQ